jgi:hypothetical protein
LISLADAVGLRPALCRVVADELFEPGRKDNIDDEADFCSSGKT